MRGRSSDSLGELFAACVLRRQLHSHSMSLPLRFLRALLSAVLFLMIGVLVMLLLVSGLSTVSLSDDATWKAGGWRALAATVGCLVALYFINRWLREKPLSPDAGAAPRRLFWPSGHSTLLPWISPPEPYRN